MKNRYLTVIPRWYDYEHADNPHSEISLKGRWLMDAGFNPHDKVTVLVEDGFLRIIKIIEKGGEKNEKQ